MKNTHVNHRRRIRDRFKQTGLEGFAPHEMLELLLFYAIPRRDTNKIAHQMIQTFGSLHNLLDASVEEIQDACEVSENTAVLLALIPHMARQYQLSKQGTKVFIANSQDAGNYAIDLLMDKNVEHFYMLCLNVQNQLLEVVLLQEGTIDAVHFYSRDIVKMALRFHAVSVIIAHNHPGGSVNPSNTDIVGTRDMRDILSTIEVELIDHIIVSGDTYFSMAEKKLLHLGDY